MFNFNATLNTIEAKVVDSDDTITVVPAMYKGEQIKMFHHGSEHPVPYWVMTEIGYIYAGDPAVGLHLVRPTFHHAALWIDVPQGQIMKEDVVRESLNW